MRAVGRKALLDALAEELTPGTVRFSSKLVSIDAIPAAGGSSEATVLRLEDGAVIRAKVSYSSPSNTHMYAARKNELGCMIILMKQLVHLSRVRTSPASDRLRRRALGGGAVAGPVGATEVGPVHHPRPLRVP